MPKKPSTFLTMEEYPPLSIRSWQTLIVQAVHRADRAGVRFEFGVVDDARQAGRTVVHKLPAVLTPNSPLSRFLSDGFGVLLAEHQSFDLATIVGRQCQARFDKGIDGVPQAIVAVKARCRSNDSSNTATEQPESTGELG